MLRIYRIRINPSEFSSNLASNFRVFHGFKNMPESEIRISCAKFFSVAQEIPNILLHHPTKEELRTSSQIRENPTY